MNDSTSDARVTTVTAEVRVLMVGSRQVTLSVYNQLDYADCDQIEPFGRVQPKDASPGWVHIVGRDTETGALVRSAVPATPEDIQEEALKDSKARTCRMHRDECIKQAEDVQLQAEEAERDARRKLRHESRDTSARHNCVSYIGFDGCVSCLEEKLSELLAAGVADELERLTALLNAERCRLAIERLRDEAAELQDGAERDRTEAAGCRLAAREWDTAAAENAAKDKERYAALEKTAAEWSALPLIVLAGLR